MIKHRIKEYREGDLAVRETEITFFSLPIYKVKKTSTNNVAVAQLTPRERKLHIDGFKNN